jgi:hypothetical protein
LGRLACVRVVWGEAKGTRSCCVQVRGRVGVVGGEVQTDMESCGGVIEELVVAVMGCLAGV